VPRRPARVLSLRNRAGGLEAVPGRRSPDRERHVHQRHDPCRGDPGPPGASQSCGQDPRRRGLGGACPPGTRRRDVSRCDVDLVDHGNCALLAPATPRAREQRGRPAISVGAPGRGLISLLCYGRARMIRRFSVGVLCTIVLLCGCSKVREIVGLPATSDPSFNQRSAENRWLLVQNPRFGDVPSEPEYIWVEEDKVPTTFKTLLRGSKSIIAPPEIVAK